MLKALLKKQFQEVWLSRRSQNKKKSGPGYLILLIFAYMCVGVVFYQIADNLAGPLIQAGLAWFYFALMGMIALFFGTFGSVFSTYSSLYLAGDNETLLSLPIPPGKILLARMSTVYITGLFFEAVAMIPTLIAAWLVEMPPAGTIVLQILLIFALALVVLALSCLMGWVVALISVRLKNKRFITVLITLTFLGLYYYVYFRMNTMLQELLQQADSLEKKLGAVWPVVQFGKAADGGIQAFLLFLLMAIIVTVVCWVIMSRTFLRVAATNKGETQKVYREQPMQKKSLSQALLSRELKRFTSSSTYMLNCGLGIIMMPIAAVYLIIRGQNMADAVQTFFVSAPSGMLEAIVIAALMLMLAMNDMTAPSISLEGKNLWIIQSLPVAPFEVLKAKLRMHLLLTLIPGILLVGAAIFVLHLSPVMALLLVLTLILFTLFFAEFGLMMNLVRPHFDWTTEAAPVKQSMSVMLTLFGGWIVAGAYFLVFVILDGAVAVTLYTAIWLAALLIGSILMYLWLKRKGSHILEIL